jgi:hypothetical protein
MSGTIQQAAFAGRLDGIKYYVRKGLIEEYDPRGFCAIHYAAEKGFIK